MMWKRIQLTITSKKIADSELEESSVIQNFRITSQRLYY